MATNVDDTPRDGLRATVVLIAVAFLEDTHIFPAVFLIAKAQRHSMGREKLFVGRRCRVEDTQLLRDRVGPVKRDVPHLEFLRLFRVIPGSFACVFANTKKVSKSH